MSITLYGKDVIKDFEKGNLFWIIWVGLKCHNMHSYRHTEEGRHEGEGDVKKRCDFKTRNARAVPEIERGKEWILPTEHLEGAWPCWISDL